MQLPRPNDRTLFRVVRYIYPVVTQGRGLLWNDRNGWDSRCYFFLWLRCPLCEEFRVGRWLYSDTTSDLPRYGHFQVLCINVRKELCEAVPSIIMEPQL